MIEVLTKATVFIAIIVMGYLLKRKGFFKASDFRIISKIVLNITLPCAVISNFNNLKIDMSLLFLIFIGIICNLVTVGAGYLVALKKSDDEKAFNMINFSGYNIGCFAMPYVQNFLRPIGVVATCLFDAGNSLLCTGGTYSIASAVAKTDGKTTLSSFIKKVFSSIPLNTYIIMLIVSYFNFQIPKPIIMFTDTVGAGNGFLAMLMVGVGLELNLKRSQIGKIVQTLSIRYGISIIMAFIFFIFLPFSLEVRQVLAIIVFAPVSAVSIAFTEKCNGDVGLASAINSSSIIFSIIVMTSMLLIMNV
ncbi:AEC family transporter [Clostridium neonatale]|uniref:AEC family transporter n=1 Tax=Clostridium neonatale TaxID=137838 RepID=UPI00291B728D|nr:AEC family transporter [Clostridium neonatale]CAI3694502.1 putative membrane protein [Clostridium neonatale]CAI3695663.1 putative membrane protein [Clostridium neonatale]